MSTTPKFSRPGLDLDATRAAVTQAHESKRLGLAALHDQAEGEAQKAEARLAKLRRDDQDGKLAADDWTE